MKPKIKVWVTFSDELKFGDGRARLLESIAKRGSLQTATREFAMSYRHAWGYLRELERAAGFKFVERVPGGGPQSGMRLTTEAKQFLTRYWRFRKSLDNALAGHFARAFPGPKRRRLTGRRREVALRARKSWRSRLGAH